MSYIFVIFTETHKIPLTEIKSLRIVYADVIFAYFPKFINPTDLLVVTCLFVE